ncbi:calcium-dependent phosphotriesterase [Lecanosticta acicola]|uniref:Calcium-dependent phosphotriesterase n=1 Tax=Lecanosticta acicola TaxID=111012 RepID=A0AAI8Z685_9PEZI|nr:calcium-dependent phosphotriesterase [Lecanosticta acicola]
MALPKNCVRVSREERCHLDRALALRQFQEPHFAVHDNAFLDIIGSAPSIELGLEKDWPFAHEAGVYLPDQDAVYITSNGLDTASGKGIKLGKMSRSNGRWSYEELQTGVTMGNGGVNYRDGVLFCDQGNQTKAGGLVWMEARPPYKTQTLISSYHWRRFSSVNDVVVHGDGSIWFTDPCYGYEQGFRPLPQLPCQVYRFEADTGDMRVVADGFGRPNGLCFSPDEKTMYVTDTDWIHGDGTTDHTRVSTIYAFDVMERHGSSFLANRRVFAMADEGIPDGIKCDLQGNVYSGCGDGVHVWSAGGRLLGKVRVAGGVANFCFGRKGEMFLLNETKFWVVRVSERVQGALLANMKISV